MRPFFRIILLCLLVLVGLLPGRGLADGSLPSVLQENIRVEYVARPGFYMRDERGNRSGYGYDYLQYLATYTNWRYTYLDALPTRAWSKIMDDLRTGRVDILLNVHKTPAREQEFLYAARPMSYDYMTLLVRTTDKKHLTKQYATYNAMRVGYVQGNIQAEDLPRFAADKGFQYEAVVFASAGEAEAALRSGAIDALIPPSGQQYPLDTRVLDRAYPHPLYAVMRRGDEWRMAQLDAAQAKLEQLHPEWSHVTQALYYQDSGPLVASLSEEERAYLEQLQQQGIVLRVLMLPHSAPYAYMDDSGQPQGLLVDWFQEMAARLDLPYEIYPVDSVKEVEELVATGKADVLLGTSMTLSIAEQTGYKVSAPILQVPMAQVTRKSFTGTVDRLGLPAATKLRLEHANTMPTGLGVSVYPTFAQAVDGLRAGACDAVETPALVVQDYLHKHPRNDLNVRILPAQSVTLRLGVRADIDPRLLTIFECAMPHESDQAIQRSLQQHSQYTPGEISTLDYLLDHPLQLLGFALVIILLLTITFFNIMRIHNNRQLEQRREELEQFVAYVCRANYLVVQVDLEEESCVEYHLDADGTVRMEKKPYHLLDYTENLLPEDRNRFLPGHDIYESIVTSLAAGHPYRCELRRRSPAGEPGYVACTFQPANNGSPDRRRFFFYASDITQAREKELQQQEALATAARNAKLASEAKGNFLSSMSHEIRTPLNAIIGYLQLVDNQGKDCETVRHAIHNSHIAANHLLELINNILDMNAIGQGKLKLASDAIDLSQMLQALRTIFQGQCERKNVQLVFDTTNMPVHRVQGDPLHIRQILTNIISNAIKFTPAGGEVRVEVIQVLKEDVCMTTFCIRDTGIGMSQADIEKLYKPFEQASAETKQQYGGSGLGMAISWNLIKLMHGSIEVESAPGQGTNFFVTLPLALPEEHPERPAAPAVTPDFGPHGCHLLVVDDNEMNREITQAILEERGYTTDTAVDGRDAVDKFTSAPAGTYDAVLMDVQMPVLDGYGATQAIRRSQHPDKGRICIIGLSADVFADDVARGLACGMNDYIGKPVDAQKLATILAQQLHARRQGTPPPAA